jgi:hypothetical protein
MYVSRHGKAKPPAPGERKFTFCGRYRSPPDVKRVHLLRSMSLTHFTWCWWVCLTVGWYIRTCRNIYRASSSLREEAWMICSTDVHGPPYRRKYSFIMLNNTRPFVGPRSGPRSRQPCLDTSLRLVQAPDGIIYNHMMINRIDPRVVVVPE